MVRQLLTESFLLAWLGAGLALLLAYWIIGHLPGLLSSTLFVSDIDIRLDRRVVAFTLLVSLISVFGFGLVPAIRAARFDLSETLKQHATAATRRFRGWTLGKLLVRLPAGIVDHAPRGRRASGTHLLERATHPARIR